MRVTEFDEPQPEPELPSFEEIEAEREVALSTQADEALKGVNLPTHEEAQQEMSDKADEFLNNADYYLSTIEEVVSMSSEEQADMVAQVLQKEESESEDSEYSRHVDYFIEMGSRFAKDKLGEKEEVGERYARFVLALHRFPAVMQLDFEGLTKKFPLFCTYEGAVYRVTGCSRMGDVWLTSKVDNPNSGYEKRVMVDKCSLWSTSKDYEHNYAQRFFDKKTQLYCLEPVQLNADN